ncbi:hypothetical protein BU16DRAFT_529481 [Lophium mytilinum]|uniref:RNase III domain-containing protein n=1 Tax=Lophium mytilinum TaxID=390894 RepID=A0A6A6QKA3_9PEZI|nr:hypothetical protein BU16DRAFT_529481 [Lophium mytilinum]
MASKRPITTLARLAPSRPHNHSIPPPQTRLQTAPFTTTTTLPLAHHDTAAAPRPRWQQTPARMVAPFRTRPRPEGPEYVVNTDPRRLDNVYVKLLGKDGDKYLSEEVKWLAVTHKSFDHGRRGFNDRLAVLGRRVISLQTSLALLNSAPPGAANDPPTPDAYDRLPVAHPALAGLASLTADAKAEVLSKTRLAQLAERYGLDTVTRWKPKKTDNLHGSGVEVVLTTSLYAIVGAVALEKGGHIAERVVREKILTPLGL